MNNNITPNANGTDFTVLEKKELKVYYLPGAEEWWAAYSPEEAVCKYNEQLDAEDDIDKEFMEKIEDVSEVSQEGLQKLVYNDNESYPQRTITFTQLLSETKEAGFFAIGNF